MKEYQSGQPLAEVFGFTINDHSEEAIRHRSLRLCPFNNKVPNCTKDKAKDPLGVCSIYHENVIVITCPIRFRQDWIILEHAADFFFEKGTNWTSLVEVRLNDAFGKPAGNIDIVLVAYDNDGKVIDFGALEVQAVYISGNIRDPFKYYMDNIQTKRDMTWPTGPNYPRPDYLSSSRKRLVPQLLYKGGILHSWGKKIAVALNRSFFATLPTMRRVPKDQAEIAWLVYDLVLHKNESLGTERFYLQKFDEVYTEFQPALLSITTPTPGRIDDFVELLQRKLDEQMETPPNNETIEKPF